MVARKPQRNTKQRQVVLEELRKLSSHPTAAELYEIARRRLPRISLGTVYRNLEVLVENGEVQKVEVSGSESRFDGNPTHHYHIRCVQCGRVDDVHDVPEPLLDRPMDPVAGYKVLGFRLEFVGVCPGCANLISTRGECPPVNRLSNWKSGQ